MLLGKPTTVNFLRVFAVCGRTRNFLGLLADRILNFLQIKQILELLEGEENSNDGMSSDEESVLDHFAFRFRGGFEVRAVQTFLHMLLRK